MKAIALVPLAMQGKPAACVHFSPIGDIARRRSNYSGSEQRVRARQTSLPSHLICSAPGARSEGLISSQRRLASGLAETDPGVRAVPLASAPATIMIYSEMN